MRSSSGAALVAALALLASTAAAVQVDRPVYVTPNEHGVYGFGERATGGAAGETVEVDTATWRLPAATVNCTETAGDDPGFCPDHCGSADTGDDDTCSFSEAVCKGNRVVEFAISGAIPIPESCIVGDGLAGCSFELKDCPTANKPIKNLTIDGSTAPGAGVYLEGGDFAISGSAGSTGNPGPSAENVVVKHLRHRGSSTVGYLSAGIYVAGCVNCALTHTSITYTQTYLGAVNSGFYGFYGERNRAISWGHSLFAHSHIFGSSQGASGAGTVLSYGTCSTTTSRKCCIDGDGTSPPLDGQCPGTETCNGEGTHCRVVNATGKVFSIQGRSASPNAGATCSTDWDAQYGECRAFCEGTGTDANKRAGLDLGPTVRRYSTAYGLNDSTGQTCLCGTPSCRCECPQATNYTRGPFLDYGQNNYGHFVAANVSEFSWYRNLIMGVKWRQPNLSPDTSSGDTTPSPAADEAMPGRYDIVQNVAYGGRYKSEIWSEYSSRNASIVFSRNYHFMSSALKNLYSDLMGPLWSSGSFASSGATPASVDNTGPNVRIYFDENLDRFHSVGSESCSAGSGCGTDQSYSWACSATQDPAGPTPPCTGVAGQDGYPEHGYYGLRKPHKNYPPFPSTFADLKDEVSAEAGATLPCRDAVDTYLGELVDAGVALRVQHHRDELGGVQQDMSVCPDDVGSATLTAQSKTGTSAVDVSYASGINSTTATVTTSETRLLKMHCGIESAGSVLARVRDPRCNGGVVTIDFDVGTGGSALANGCYPVTYWMSIGRWASRATATIQVDVGGGSC
jgi:hypothetical protein